MVKKLIIGIGGAGANISQFIVENLNEMSELLLINTDKSSLDRHSTTNRILLDLTLSSDAKKSEKIANAASCVESELLKYSHDKSDIVIIAGLGGYTGTYAFPSIANLLRNNGKNVTLVVVFPFSFEGSRRRLAEEAFGAFKNSTTINTITFDNDSVMARNLSLNDVFRKANDAIITHVIV